ncbi:MAG: hypothetical protein SFX18_03830 [Pirellulales bacterium]|nr:hypothetical protein [Pirellulales bacterium]
MNPPNPQFPPQTGQPTPLGHSPQSLQPGQFPVPVVQAATGGVPVFPQGQVYAPGGNSFPGQAYPAQGAPFPVSGGASGTGSPLWPGQPTFSAGNSATAHPAYPQPVPAYPQPDSPQSNASQPVPVFPQSGSPAAAVPLPVPKIATGATIATVANPQAPVSIPKIQASIGKTAKPQPVPKPVPIPAKPIPVKKDAGTEIVRDHTEEELQEEEPQKVLIRNTPPFLISMVLHIALVLILALCITTIELPKFREIQVSVEEPEDIWAEALGDQLIAETTIEGPKNPEITEQDISINDLPPVDDPFAAPTPMEIVPDGVTATSSIIAPVNGIADGRQVGSKKGLLARFGGNRTTEEAVIAGLRWLVRQQNPQTKAWSLVGPYKGGGTFENPTAATAMALLAFQGFGITDKPDLSNEYSKEFTPVVAGGWNALLKMQTEEGLFTSAAIDNGNQQHFYTHGQCLMAVCEMYAMTKDPKYKAAAQRAIDYAVKNQDPQAGGWRYALTPDSDTSVTGWLLMGLMSGRIAGLDVPESAFQNITRYLDAAQGDGGSTYHYRPNYGSPTAAMTAEGLLMRQYLGWQRDDERLVNGVRRLVANPVSMEKMNVYYWYYATQVCHHMEGDYWKEWNAVMRQALPSAQVKTGAEKGSWDPDGDEWGSNGGRLFTTCFSIYMLEVYYRHMPLYDKLYEAKAGQMPTAPAPKLNPPQENPDAVNPAAAAMDAPMASVPPKANAQ